MRRCRYLELLSKPLEVEQYWLSYIDALIREKQFDNAKQVLEQQGSRVWMEGG